MSSITQEFTKGLWKEIPLFRLVLGLCPALAVTTTAENSLGMGLAVCQRIIENQGGQLTVENAKGGGARFRVWLPACKL